MKPTQMSKIIQDIRKPIRWYPHFTKEAESRITTTSLRASDSIIRLVPAGSAFTADTEYITIA